MTSPPTVDAGSRRIRPPNTVTSPSDLRFLIDADVAAKNGCVAADLTLILNHNASAERSHVSRYMSAHSDAAAKAGRVADFFIGPDADVVSHVGAIAIGKGGAREQHSDEEAGA